MRFWMMQSNLLWEVMHYRFSQQPAIDTRKDRDCGRELNLDLLFKLYEPLLCDRIYLK